MHVFVQGRKHTVLVSVALALILTGRVSAQTGPIKGNLHVVSVGVDNPTYGDTNQPLRGAAKDAEAEARFWATQQGKLFHQVHVAPALTNESATRQAVLANLDRLIESAQPGDTVVVALSGHGGIDPRTGQYAYCAYDVPVSAAELRERVEKLARKGVRVLLIVDTCHAGAIGIHGDNIIVLAACAADEYAADGPSNGLYTQVLLTGLNGAADANKDGIITLAELDVYVATQMEKARCTQCPTCGRPANIRSNLPLATVGDSFHHSEQRRRNGTNPSTAITVSLGQRDIPLALFCRGYLPTTESKTRTFFQLSLFSSMNCWCRLASWYLSWDALSLKTMCRATSKSRSLTSRLRSSARVPAAKKTSPGCFDR